MTCFVIDSPMTCSNCGKTAPVPIRVDGDPEMSAEDQEEIGALMVLAFENEYGPPLCDACSDVP